MAKLFDPALVFTQIPILLESLPTTLLLTVLAMAGGLIVGLGAALVKINKTPLLRQICAVYVSLSRGTPIVVQLYLTYFGIPLVLKYLNFYWGTHFNINAVPPVVFALAALALNQGAYSSETLRAAILSVDKGQIEAAQSLGMSGPQVLLRIIVPEAFVVALPSLGNSLIVMLKETSLAFVCSVVEITAHAKILAGATYRFFESYCSVAIIYWVLTFAIEQGIKVWEAHIRVPDAPRLPKSEQISGRKHEYAAA